MKKQKMKQLKFEHDFAKAITRGERQTTLRIDDKDIHVGESLQLVDKTSSNKPQLWEIPGELSVVGVQTFFLESMPLELLKGAEIGEVDRESLYTFLRRFYGERINEETVVKLVQFEFVPYKKPVPYMLKQSSAGVSGRLPERVFLYADGGSRGNPGPSAAGFVIEDEHGTVLESWNKYLGVTTNNQAEYHGLIAALEWCKQYQIQEVEVRLDSLLVVSQMLGKFKVKNRDLWTLYETAKRLQTEFRNISFTHIPRELNHRADLEVNKALDSMSGKDIVQ